MKKKAAKKANAVIDAACLVVRDAQSRVVGSPDHAIVSWFWMNRLLDALIRFDPTQEDQLQRGARRPDYGDIPRNERPVR